MKDNDRELVELKVTGLLQTDRQKLNFEKLKMLRFYCQSYLANTRGLFIGFRDNTGVLRMDFSCLLFC